MNFGFTDDQNLLRTQVQKFLSEVAPLPRVREIVESNRSDSPGFDRALWKEISALGWPGLALPESQGGSGLDLETLIVVLEEAGRALLPCPIVPSIVAGKAIERFGSEAQRARWLPGLADGSRIGTFATAEDDLGSGATGLQLTRAGSVGQSDRESSGGWIATGTFAFVPSAGSADLFVVPASTRTTGTTTSAMDRSAEAADSLLVLDRSTPGLSVETYASMDLTKPMGRLRLDGVRVGADDLLGEAGRAGAAVDWVRDLAAALITSEAVGAAEVALEKTADFAKERVQFGQPIGRFQGVKHPLAEMFVDLESFRSLVYYAIWAIDHDAPDAALAVSRAKAYCSDAFLQLATMGIQLHGGVGFTWEYDIQMYLKRAKWVRAMAGDADYHYERAARLGGL